MCSARMLYSHLYATKMPICTAIVVTDVNKEKDTVQKPQRFNQKRQNSREPHQLYASYIVYPQT